jgi:hypothetical protein
VERYIQLPGAGSTVALGPGDTVAQALSQTTHSNAMSAARIGPASSIDELIRSHGDRVSPPALGLGLGQVFRRHPWSRRVSLVPQREDKVIAGREVA